MEPFFKRAKKGEKVLDVGCGNGRFFSFLFHTDYTGVDFSENMIEEARKKFPQARFVVANALHLPFEDGVFDRIYSVALIHHIPSKDYRIKALKEMKRVLKPGGEVFVTAWNRSKKSSFLSRFMSMFSPFDAHDTIIPFNKRERYYHLFQKGELAFVAKKAGLYVKKEGVLSKGKRSNLYIVAKNDKRK